MYFLNRLKTYIPTYRLMEKCNHLNIAALKLFSVHDVLPYCFLMWAPICVLLYMRDTTRKRIIGILGSRIQNPHYNRLPTKTDQDHIKIEIKAVAAICCWTNGLFLIFS